MLKIIGSPVGLFLKRNTLRYGISIYSGDMYFAEFITERGMLGEYFYQQDVDNNKLYYWSGAAWEESTATSVSIDRAYWFTTLDVVLHKESRDERDLFINTTHKLRFHEDPILKQEQTYASTLIYKIIKKCYNKDLEEVLENELELQTKTLLSITEFENKLKTLLSPEMSKKLIDSAKELSKC